MKINPRLKEFVAQDVRNQDISGTNVYRKTKPKTGRWRQITPQPCCSAFELSYTPPDVTDDTFTVTVKCGSTTIATVLVSQAAPTVTIHDVVDLLRKQAKFIGKWATDGTVIELQLTSDLALNCADVSTLSFTVTV